MSDDKLRSLGQMAMAHHRAGEFHEAEITYRQILELTADNVKVLHALGHVCFLQNKLMEAAGFLKRACSLDRHDPELHFNLAGVLAAADDTESAMTQYQQAIQLKPDYPDAHLNLGVIHYQMLAYSEAIDCYRRVLAADESNVKARYNLGLSLLRIGKSGDAHSCFRQSLDLDPGNHIFHSTLLYTLQTLPDLTEKEIYEEHLGWERQHASQFFKKDKPDKGGRDTHAPIRVGYVSPDFKTHSVAYFVAPLLQAHDKTVVSSYCYSNTIQPDAVTRRLTGLTDHWRDISNLTDEQCVRQIRKDKIDILVDLSGHTDRNRLLVFARKPARVQVTYLGYPDTTGLHAMDYRITDSWADPDDRTDHCYSEQLVRLESGFLCYEPPADAPDTGDLPALQDGHITFGSFNNLSKITPQHLCTWARILKNVPGSRLLLKAKGLGDNAGRSGIYSTLHSKGISADRIECVGHIGATDKHLSLYNRVDIALDTFPYNGTTTSCEALWMGVPVITLAGARHSSRVGVSLLSAVGLPECIAESEKHYIELATRLALDTGRVSELRQCLRHRMRNSRLMDSEKFARCLERHYIRMLEDYRDNRD